MVGSFRDPHYIMQVNVYSLPLETHRYNKRAPGEFVILSRSEIHPFFIYNLTNLFYKHMYLLFVKSDGFLFVHRYVTGLVQTTDSL